MQPLYEHQIDALNKMHNGCILCGGVGSGKSRTAIAYYHISCGGKIEVNGVGAFRGMTNPRPLYIITTAKKRDSQEWDMECCLFYIKDFVVDSWNNIKKYTKVYGAFFIFDEQRVIGKGAWVKAFLQIARKNKWILLSATPGDTWSDYIPVFVANGFYKNRTEFLAMHAVWSRYSKYPKIERYLDIDILEELRDKILVPMPYEKHTEHHHIDIKCGYSRPKYTKVWRDRWDPYKDEPIAEPSALFYCMRRVVNDDPSRITEVKKILDEHPRTIIFYNFNYELDKLRAMCEERGLPYGEWNGQVHSEIPKAESWAYLVQYTAGSEGWNCIETDTIIFFSQNYSYRVMVQAAGRIDRLNTPYEHLYFYHLKSYAPIDIAITKALKEKETFNENKFLKKQSF